MTVTEDPSNGHQHGSSGFSSGIIGVSKDSNDAWPTNYQVEETECNRRNDCMCLRLGKLRITFCFLILIERRLFLVFVIMMRYMMNVILCVPELGIVAGTHWCSSWWWPHDGDHGDHMMLIMVIIWWWSRWSYDGDHMMLMMISLR